MSEAASRAAEAVRGVAWQEYEADCFVVTNHRRPVADLVPHREAAGISGAELMRRLRRTHRDSGWLGELNASRESESARDPWA